LSIQSIYARRARRGTVRLTAQHGRLRGVADPNPNSLSRIRRTVGKLPGCGNRFSCHAIFVTLRQHDVHASTRYFNSPERVIWPEAHRALAHPQFRFFAVFSGIEFGFRQPTKMSSGAAFEPELTPHCVKPSRGTSVKHSLRMTSEVKNRTASSVRHTPNTEHNPHSWRFHVETPGVVVRRLLFGPFPRGNGHHRLRAQHSSADRHFRGKDFHSGRFHVNPLSHSGFHFA
jgi:hypothetical protein